MRRGPTVDGIGRDLEGIIAESLDPVADVVEELERSRTQVLVNYLPVCAQRATELFARCALDAG